MTPEEELRLREETVRRLERVVVDRLAEADAARFHAIVAAEEAREAHRHARRAIAAAVIAFVAALVHLVGTSL